MKKILPINDKPRITSYVQHSYLNAIVTNDQLFNVYIKDFNKTDWTVLKTDVEWEVDDNSESIILRDTINRKSTDFKIESKSEIRELVIRVNEVKIMDNLTSVKVMIRDEDSGIVPFFMKWNQYDININDCLNTHDNHLYLYYKLVAENGKVIVHVSDDNYEWEIIKQISVAIEKPQIEVELFFGDNQYNTWKNMNYIQLFYNEDDPNTVNVDYYMFTRKGWDASYNCMCNFVDTEYIDSPQLDDNQKLIDYLQKSIDEHYYVNVMLDEFYVEGRGPYNKFHYDHYDLVYGYDEKTFYIFGYKDNGKMSKTCVLYDNFLKAAYRRHIVRYKINYNTVSYRFNIGYVKQTLMEYVEGIDSSIKFAGILTQRKGTYGLKIFEILKKSENARGLLINDGRVSFLLLEHCRLMQERLDYLIDNGYIENKEIETLLERCNNMVKSANLLKNLVIKHALKQQFQNEILKSLDELYHNEKMFYDLLLPNIKL